MQARPDRMSRSSLGSLLVVVGMSLFFVGCGNANPYATIPVTGVVKYVDGSLIPAQRITLKFISEQPPLDPKTHPRPGLGEVNVEDGSFVVSTYDFDDGLIRGKHRVTVMSVDGRGLPSSEVPRRYHLPETSGLVVDTEKLPFELLIENPR